MECVQLAAAFPPASLLAESRAITEIVPTSPDPANAAFAASELAGPQFIMNLHELPRSGPLHEWFQMAHATNASISRQALYMAAPLKAYDAILFIDTITPSPAPQKR